MSKAIWRKASRSTAQNDNCIEVARVSKVVAIRDSKNPDGPKVTLVGSDFRGFIETLKSL